MTKRRFFELLTVASQPLPAKEGKPAPSGGYTEKQTPKHTKPDSTAKPRGKSRQSNA